MIANDHAESQMIANKYRNKGQLFAILFHVMSQEDQPLNLVHHQIDICSLADQTWVPLSGTEGRNTLKTVANSRK